jgi:glutathione peroxidase
MKGFCVDIYDFIVKNNMDKEVSLNEYKGKVLLIVNTASKCGFTPQFAGLQKLYEKYGNEKFEILAFPCNQFANQEPKTDEEIKTFCALNYGTTFPIFKKIEVNGKNAEPLFKYLREKTPGLLGDALKWNFTKFLIDSKGNVIKRYSPATKPVKLEAKIKELMEEVN